MQPQTAPWPARRIAWWALIATVAVLWQGRGLWRALRPRADVVVDFFQEWASARNYFNGESIYEAQRASSLRYLGVSPAGNAHFFIEVNAHPPTAVLLGLPLAALDYRAAVLVWNCCSIAALAAAIWLIAGQFGYPIAGWSILPVIAVLALCWPLRSHLQQGQLAMILLLLITGGWAAERSGRATLAGVLFGTAAAIKLFPAILFLPFIVRREWRVVFAGGAWLAALTGATVLILGPGIYTEYFSDALPVVAEWRSAWNNASLTGLWSKLFDPGLKGSGVEPLVHSPTLAHALMILSSAFVVFLLIRLARRAECIGDRDRAFSAAVVGMLLVSPVTWEHGFLLLLLPLAVLWSALPAGSVQRRVLIMLFVVLLWVNPAFFYRQWQIGRSVGGPRVFCSAAEVLTLLSAQCYALVSLFVMTVRSGAIAKSATVAEPTVLKMDRVERRAA